MQVRILFFGMLKDLVGRNREEIELPEGSSVAEVLAHYESQVPDLKKWFSSVALAVNHGAPLRAAESLAADRPRGYVRADSR